MNHNIWTLRLKKILYIVANAAKLNREKFSGVQRKRMNLGASENGGIGFFSERDRSVCTADPGSSKRPTRK